MPVDVSLNVVSSRKKPHDFPICEKQYPMREGSTRNICSRACPPLLSRTLISCPMHLMRLLLKPSALGLITVTWANSAVMEKMRLLL